MHHIIWNPKSDFSDLMTLDDPDPTCDHQRLRRVLKSIRHTIHADWFAVLSNAVAICPANPAITNNKNVNFDLAYNVNSELQKEFRRSVWNFIYRDIEWWLSFENQPFVSMIPGGGRFCPIRTRVCCNNATGWRLITQPRWQFGTIT